MFSFVSIFPLTSVLLSTPEISTGCRKSYSKVRSIPGRAITTAVTYRFLSKLTTKHAASFDDIMRYNL